MATVNGATRLLAQLIETPLGTMLAAASDKGLCLLEFEDRGALDSEIEFLQKRFQGSVVSGDHPHIVSICGELDRYFAGALREFKTPLAISGTPFQEAVWRRLLAIPYGQTLSYGQLAQELGLLGVQRAVGKANGDNRLAIVVPCHRVIRSDGTLCGYGGGLWRKKRLLELERGETSLFP